MTPQPQLFIETYTHAVCPGQIWYQIVCGDDEWFGMSYVYNLTLEYRDKD